MRFLVVVGRHYYHPRISHWSYRLFILLLSGLATVTLSSSPSRPASSSSFVGVQPHKTKENHQRLLPSRSSKKNNNNHKMSTESVSKPKYKTILFDMDGVLAEVSKSYRAAILLTCQHYGAKSVTDQTVTEWKIRGNANCDWTLSRNLILDDPDGQKGVTLEQVTETFEEFYQGTPEKEGLYKLETLIPTRTTLDQLKARSKAGLGIVTGRPRSDCMKFLKDMDLEDLFTAFYCAGDGPSKPSPEPVLKVCQQLNITPDKSVVLIGDTPDDIRAAVAAGCSGVGVTTPEAVVVQEAKEEAHHLAPMSVAMAECGADMVLEPGFAELLQYCSTE